MSKNSSDTPSTPPCTDAELRSGHRARLRSRFLAEPSALPDYELLELALGHVYLRRDNKMLAKRLLHRFGSIAGILAASDAERRMVEGCGEAVDNFCALIREIIARSSQNTVQEKRSMTLEDIVNMGYERLRFTSVEEVWTALLDKQNRLITFLKVRQGVFDRVALDAFELVELMMRHRASSLVLMHNHPDGTNSSSMADRELTGRIDAAFRHLGLTLFDHIIITSQGCFSIKLDRCLHLTRP